MNVRFYISCLLLIGEVTIFLKIRAMESHLEPLLLKLSGHHTLLCSILYLLTQPLTESEEIGLLERLIRAKNNTQLTLDDLLSRSREDSALDQEALQAVSGLQAYLKSHEWIRGEQAQAELDQLRVALEPLP